MMKSLGNPLSKYLLRMAVFHNSFEEFAVNILNKYPKQTNIMYNVTINHEYLFTRV